MGFSAYSALMRSRICKPSGLLPAGLALLLGIQMAACARKAESHAVRLDLAGGQIACQIISPQADIPPRVLTVLPMAMNAALDHVGLPAGQVQLVLRLQPPSSFRARLRARFRPEPAASQRGEEIRLYPDEDPLKLTFRLAHELSHWLVQQKHPARPPLWLDEGLAQLAATAAAETSARVHKQTLARPQPPGLAQHFSTLEELTAFSSYPPSAEASAAFYWQAEALVSAIRRKLGPAGFHEYLAMLCRPDAPGWQNPLRDRWYFSEADFQALGRAITPGPEQADNP